MPVWPPSLRLVMRGYFAFRAMRTAEIEPRTTLGALRTEGIITRRDLPQFGEAASYSRSGGGAHRRSITLTRPASGGAKTWVIHVSKSDIPSIFQV